MYKLPRKAHRVRDSDRTRGIHITETGKKTEDTTMKKVVNAILSFFLGEENMRRLKTEFE